MVSIQWSILRIYNLMLQSVRKEFSHNLKTLSLEVQVKDGLINHNQDQEVEVNKLNWGLNKWELDLLTSIITKCCNHKIKLYKINLPVFKINLKTIKTIRKLTKYSVKLVREQWKELIKLNLCMLLQKSLRKFNLK